MQYVIAILLAFHMIVFTIFLGRFSHQRGRTPYYDLAKGERPQKINLLWCTIGVGPHLIVTILPLGNDPRHKYAHVQLVMLDDSYYS